MMRVTIAVASALVAVVAVGMGAATAQEGITRCRTGEAQGFLQLKADPQLASILPSRFIDDAHIFERRYNCRGRSASVRRVDVGVFEARFPGLPDRVAEVSAISSQGVSASVIPVFDGVYRITLRGPIEGSDPLTTRRDTSFSIVLF